MPRVRMAAVLTAVLLMGGLLAVGAESPAATSHPSCALLANPSLRSALSGAGETALLLRCGGQLPSSAPSVGQPSRPFRPLLGADALINDRSTDTFPHITQSETTIAVSGTNLLAGYNDSGQFLSTGDLSGYARSIDGGITWTDMGVPTTPLGVVDAVFGDPVIAADLNRNPGEAGVFYFANLGVLSNGTSILSVHKTIDAGATWVQAANATPGALSSDFQDKEWLAVDSRASGTGAGNVYVCWSRFFSGGVQIRLARSTDGGASFTIVQTDLSADTDVSGCQVAVDPTNGNVYVSWTNRNFGVSPRTIKFRRSTDQGTTFDPETLIGTAPIAETTTTCGSTVRTVFVDSESGGTSRAIRSTSFSSMAVDTSGQIHVIFHRAGLVGGSLADIAYVRSTDGGVTFSPETRINSTVDGQQFFPAIAANKAGKLRAIYYSTQLSATNRLLDVYMVNSTDGGVTWTSPKRVTDVSFDRPVTNPNFDSGPGLTLASCYMGDYNDVSAAGVGLGNKKLWIIWGDNRLDGDPGTPGVQPDPDIRVDK